MLKSRACTVSFCPVATDTGAAIERDTLSLEAHDGVCLENHAGARGAYRGSSILSGLEYVSGDNSVGVRQARSIEINRPGAENDCHAGILGHREGTSAVSE